MSTWHLPRPQETGEVMPRGDTLRGDRSRGDRPRGDGPWGETGKTRWDEDEDRRGDVPPPYFLARLVGVMSSSSSSSSVDSESCWPLTRSFSFSRSSRNRPFTLPGLKVFPREFPDEELPRALDPFFGPAL